MDTYDKNYTLIFNILNSCYNNFKEIGTYNHEKTVIHGLTILPIRHIHDVIYT